MNRKRADVLFVLAVIVCLVSLGFIREHVFVNLNYQSAKVVYHDDFGYTLPASMTWLEGMSYAQLYWLKFPLTLLFAILYFAVSWVTVKRFFRGRRFIRWTVLVYALMFLVSLLLFLAGYFIGKYEAFYSVSRYIMGIQQSPLLLMLLALAFNMAPLAESQKETGPEG
jgi:hypothetical protein